ncbi:MAG: HU family DNA-binding protein [Roseiarcus sp.]
MTLARNVRTKAQSGARALTRSKAERVVEHIAKESELSKAVAEVALDAILEGVSKSLKKGDEVRLVGFGAFSVRERSSGKGRKPATGMGFGTYLSKFKFPVTSLKAHVSRFKRGARAQLKKDDEVRLVGFGIFSVGERTVGKGKSATGKETNFPASAFEPDARARALLRGVEIVQEDLRSSGGAYDLDEVRTLMRGISRQRVDRRVREGTLLAVPGPSNHRRYPTVQFNRDGTVVAGLKEVCEALPTKNPWSVLNFLVGPESRLDGRKPIDLLKTGEVEIVVEAARRLGQQGA